MGNFEGGKYWDWLHSEIDGGNIDEQSLKQPVFAVQLKNIERENFDKSLAKHQIRQYFPHQNFPLYDNLYSLYQCKLNDQCFFLEYQNTKQSCITASWYNVHIVSLKDGHQYNDIWTLCS